MSNNQQLGNQQKVPFSGNEGDHSYDGHEGHRGGEHGGGRGDGNGDGYGDRHSDGYGDHHHHHGGCGDNGGGWDGGCGDHGGGWGGGCGEPGRRLGRRLGWRPWRLLRRLGTLRGLTVPLFDLSGFRSGGRVSLLPRPSDFFPPMRSLRRIQPLLHFKLGQRCSARNRFRAEQRLTLESNGFNGLSSYSNLRERNPEWVPLWRPALPCFRDRQIFPAHAAFVTLQTGTVLFRTEQVPCGTAVDDSRKQRLQRAF